MVQTVAIFPAMIVSGKLINTVGKKKLYIIGLLTFGVLPAIRMAAPTNVPLLMVVSVLIGAGQGICMPLSYGIQADNTDYVEVKINKRMEGAVASLSSFITKFAMGVGGAIPGYLLAFAGFDSSLAAQPASVNNMIMLCLSVIPAVFSILGIIVFAAAYPLTKEKLDEQNEFLAKKRTQA
jgi:GPH family glycoside/pentoside/hexuronide:cation symporter/glucuronide carrier protein